MKNNIFDEHRYESFSGPLFNELGEIDDYLGTLEFIISQSELEPEKHARIYRECYKIFYFCLEALLEKLEQILFKTPYITELSGEDEKFQAEVKKALTRISSEHKTSKKALKVGWSNLFKIPCENEILTLTAAIQIYKSIELSDIYSLIKCIKTEINLHLSQRTETHILMFKSEHKIKQSVLKLFTSIHL